MLACMATMILLGNVYFSPCGIQTLSEYEYEDEPTKKYCVVQYFDGPNLDVDATCGQVMSAVNAELLRAQ